MDLSDRGMHLSRSGAGLAGLYVLLSAAIFLYSTQCGVGWCGVVAILPTLPWLLVIRSIYEAFGGFDSTPFGWVVTLSVALNLVSFYGIGWGFSRLRRN